MIDLESLAALYADFREDLESPVAPVRVSEDVVVGDDAVTVMGVVNLSHDSTYRESVAVSTDSAVRLGRALTSQGAAIIDLGAEASHEKADRVDAAEQIDRLVPVVEALSQRTVVSVETYRPEVAEAVLAAGARMINLTGRGEEEEILAAAGRAGATVLMVFSPSDNVRESGQLPDDDDMLPALVEHFEERLERARAAGVEKVIVDPGSGFTYDNLSGVGKAKVQSRVLAQSMRLRRLGVPSAHALPHCFDLFERDFRHAEGFFAVLAFLGRAHLLRVHEVSQVSRVLRSMRELPVR
ncbi:dihydropteroate synthase [Nocardioides seonyuensis]|uniref:Dihydropteroate synthase n=1 Tax=Nocardioides seonyuensis TaxID=2518371 RepID=A0A4P7IEW8_9ACTN|nr:dihydropteroate synthase [Nocardioides seonyuensis]QBX55809.1 dihydropteroate synthase [Nocardioides seonyuensis]